MYNGIKRDCDRPRGRADNHVISGPYSIVAARLTQDESTVVVSVVGLSRASHSRTLPHALAQAHTHGHTGPHARTHKSIHALTHTYTQTRAGARAHKHTHTSVAYKLSRARARVLRAGRRAAASTSATISSTDVTGYTRAPRTRTTHRHGVYVCMHVCTYAVLRWWRWCRWAADDDDAPAPVGQALPSTRRRR